MGGPGETWEDGIDLGRTGELDERDVGRTGETWKSKVVCARFGRSQNRRVL